MTIQEHDEIKCEKYKYIIKNYTLEYPKKYLKGDNRSNWLKYHGFYKDNDEKIRASYFAGISKLDDETICIEPKIGLDRAFEMLEICLRNKEVSKNMDEVYHIFTNEKWIEITANENDMDMSKFFIKSIKLYFLKLVSIIAKKGLKKSYIKTNKNLKNKIRGRVNITKTIKNFSSKNDITGFNCDYFRYSDDILENQILKQALLSLKDKKADQILSNFKNITDKKIKKSELLELRQNNFFKEYDKALFFAKIILFEKTINFSMNKNTTNDKKVYIPPFFIDMPLLFEKYVEVKIRECFDNCELKTQSNYETGIGELRPDFILNFENKSIIIDAKYKFYDEYKNNNKDNKDKLKRDLQQIALYLCLNEIKSESAYIVYPLFEKENIEVKEIKGFSNLYMIGIPIIEEKIQWTI